MRNGQALILILLSMAVILTVSLSMVARSVSDIKVTTGEEESLRAFSAAEAGVEEALTTNITSGTQGGNLGESAFTTTISTFPASGGQYVYPLEIDLSDTATLWLVSHDANGNLVCPDCFVGSSLRLCWGRTDQAAINPAVEVSILFVDSVALHVARDVIDPDAGRTPGASSPDGTTCTIADSTFGFRKDISMSAIGIPSSVYTTAGGLKLIRIRMLYNTDISQTLGFDSLGGILPSQGRQIDSIGTTGESTRRVNVFELYPDLPSIFDAAVYSPGGVVK